jgi:hypothetical protein
VAWTSSSALACKHAAALPAGFSTVELLDLTACRLHSSRKCAWHQLFFFIDRSVSGQPLALPDRGNDLLMVVGVSKKPDTSFGSFCQILVFVFVYLYLSVQCNEEAAQYPIPGSYVAKPTHGLLDSKDGRLSSHGRPSRHMPFQSRHS